MLLPPPKTAAWHLGSLLADEAGADPGQVAHAFVACVVELESFSAALGEPLNAVLAARVDVLRGVQLVAQGQVSPDALALLAEARELAELAWRDSLVSLGPTPLSGINRVLALGAEPDLLDAAIGDELGVWRSLARERGMEAAEPVHLALRALLLREVEQPGAIPEVLLARVRDAVDAWLAQEPLGLAGELALWVGQACAGLDVDGSAAWRLQGEETCDMLAALEEQCADMAELLPYAQSAAVARVAEAACALRGLVERCVDEMASHGALGADAGPDLAEGARALQVAREAAADAASAVGACIRCSAPLRAAASRCGQCGMVVPPGFLSSQAFVEPRMTDALETLSRVVHAYGSSAEGADELLRVVAEQRRALEQERSQLGISAYPDEAAAALDDYERGLETLAQARRSRLTLGLYFVLKGARALQELAER